MIKPNGSLFAADSGFRFWQQILSNKYIKAKALRNLLPECERTNKSMQQSDKINSHLFISLLSTKKYSGDNSPVPETLIN